MPSSGLLCLETDWGRGLADAAVWLAKAYQLPGWVPAVGENMPPQGLLVGMCIVVRVGLLHERVAQCTGSHCPPPLGERGRSCLAVQQHICHSCLQA